MVISNLVMIYQSSGSLKDDKPQRSNCLAYDKLSYIVVGSPLIEWRLIGKLLKYYLTPLKRSHFYLHCSLLFYNGSLNCQLRHRLLNEHVDLNPTTNHVAFELLLSLLGWLQTAVRRSLLEASSLHFSFWLKAMCWSRLIALGESRILMCPDSNAQQLWLAFDPLSSHRWRKRRRRWRRGAQLRGERTRRGIPPDISRLSAKPPNLRVGQQCTFISGCISILIAVRGRYALSVVVKEQRQ